MVVVDGAAARAAAAWQHAPPGRQWRKCVDGENGREAGECGVCVCVCVSVVGVWGKEAGKEEVLCLPACCCACSPSLPSQHGLCSWHTAALRTVPACLYACYFSGFFLAWHFLGRAGHTRKKHLLNSLTSFREPAYCTQDFSCLHLLPHKKHATALLLYQVYTYLCANSLD